MTAPGLSGCQLIFLPREEPGHVNRGTARSLHVWWGSTELTCVLQNPPGSGRQVPVNAARPARHPSVCLAESGQGTAEPH